MVRGILTSHFRFLKWKVFSWYYSSGDKGHMILRHILALKRGSKKYFRILSSRQCTLKCLQTCKMILKMVRITKILVHFAKIPKSMWKFRRENLSKGKCWWENQVVGKCRNFYLTRCEMPKSLVLFLHSKRGVSSQFQNSQNKRKYEYQSGGQITQLSKTVQKWLSPDC